MSRDKKMNTGYSNLNYSDRRRKLYLMTLELRRLHYDLIMWYKIVFNIVRLECNDFFLF